MVNTKFYALENNKTKSNLFFLRDYSNTLLYNTNGKTLFNHEHFIFIFDFFIKKLYISEHWYIDGTFLRPKDFSQLIIVMYYYLEYKKRFPAIYALINNKKYEGYDYLFKKIY